MYEVTYRNEEGKVCKDRLYCDNYPDVELNLRLYEQVGEEVIDVEWIG